MNTQRSVKRKRIDRESREQKQFIAIVAASMPVISDHLFAVPNGGSRHEIEAARMRAEGVRSGVSDLCLAYASTRYPVLWIEMKARKPHGATIEPEQSDWIARMRQQGHAAVVAYGCAEAVGYLAEYLAGGEVHDGIDHKIMTPEARAKRLLQRRQNRARARAKKQANTMRDQIAHEKIKG